MKWADLHLHTNFSDSSNSVSQLISAARKVNLSCIAITDHDTVEAIDSAFVLAKDSIEIIPGVELTADVNEQEIHILGYLIDYKDKNFIQKLKLFREVRISRMYEMTGRLKAMGLDINPKEVIALAHGASVGRLHLARVMVEKRIVPTIFEAFQKYIGDTCPAYVSKFKLTPKEVIELILEVKGIPVLAHPYCLPSQDLIKGLIEDGIRGIEVYYPEHAPQMTEHYKALAEKYNLLITGGSDCHGSVKKEALIGKVKIPYELVEKLKRAANV